MDFPAPRNPTSATRPRRSSSLFTPNFSASIACARRRSSGFNFSSNAIVPAISGTSPFLSCANRSTPNSIACAIRRSRIIEIFPCPVSNCAKNRSDTYADFASSFRVIDLRDLSARTRSPSIFKNSVSGRGPLCTLLLIASPNQQYSTSRPARSFLLQKQTGPAHFAPALPD